MTEVEFMTEAEEFRSEMIDPGLTHDQRLAKVKLEYAEQFSEGVRRVFNDKLEAWDSAMYLAVCVELAETMRQWTSNFGVEKEFKEWLVGFFNDESWYEALRDQGPGLMASKLKLLIEASKRDAQRESERESEDDEDDRLEVLARMHKRRRRA